MRKPSPNLQSQEFAYLLVVFERLIREVIGLRQADCGALVNHGDAELIRLLIPLQRHSEAELKSHERASKTLRNGGSTSQCSKQTTTNSDFTCTALRYGNEPSHMTQLEEGCKTLLEYKPVHSEPLSAQHSRSIQYDESFLAIYQTPQRLRTQTGSRSFIC